MLTLTTKRPFSFPRTLEFMGRFAPCRDACLLAPDQVGGAAEIVVQDLGEEHGARRYQRAPLSILKWAPPGQPQDEEAAHDHREPHRARGERAVEPLGRRLAS